MASRRGERGGVTFKSTDHQLKFPTKSLSLTFGSLGYGADVADGTYFKIDLVLCGSQIREQEVIAVTGWDFQDP